MNSDIFTKEQKEFINNNYIGITSQKLVDSLNSKFITDFTVKSVIKYKKQNKLKSGVDCKFKKGQEPPNKNKCYKGFTNSGSFKKGHVPHCKKTVGSIRIDPDGYMLIKTANPSKWELVHRVLWTRVYGKIEKGHVILFLNGDNSYIHLDNLVCIHQSILSILNKLKLISSDPELTKAGINVCILLKKIKSLEKNSKTKKRKYRMNTKWECRKVIKEWLSECTNKKEINILVNNVKELVNEEAENRIIELDNEEL